MGDTLVARPPRWEMVSLSRPHSPACVRVRIALAGLCRTDIQAMTGQREVLDGRILGHEAAGWIEAIPPSLSAAARRAGLAEGDRVAFFPFIPCGTCPACRAGAPLGTCHAPSALGLDEDGAFAPFVDLPLSVIARVPDVLSWEKAAYAEPVAAALSVLDVPEVLEAPRVAVLGEGRIASLTARLIEAFAPGREVLRWGLSSPDQPPPSSLDVVVETVPTLDAMVRTSRALRPGGLIVIKSRPANPVPWPHQAFVMRRLRAVGVSYGSFAGGIEAMAAGLFRTDGLFGPRFPWNEAGVSSALAIEHGGEGGKLFFAIGVPAYPMELS